MRNSLPAKNSVYAIFAGLGVLVTLPVCMPAGESASGAAKSSPKPAAATPTSVARPTQQRNQNLTKLYEDTCAKCHGINGEGGGAGTKTMNTREKFDQSFDRPYFDAIKNGVPTMGMEAYAATLTDEEIWGLVVHIRELQAKALRTQFGDTKAVDGVYTSQHHKYRVETVIPEGEGLATPWAIDWLPNGMMLVTNRPGKMVFAKNGKVLGEVSGLPESTEIGQGGLMDVAVHPNYATNGWIYLGFTDPSKKDGRRSGFTKIVRGKLKFSGMTASWTNQQTIFEASQDNYNGSGAHFGNRIVFDGKGHVYFSIGERGNGERAQDLTRPNGKVYRVNEDGSIPSDNPFASAEGKAKGYLPQIWSYGHRNPQGLVVGLDGTVWDTEHGPRGGDEVNRVQRGANYGWPKIAFSINYNDSPYSTPWPKEGQNFTMPVFRWLPSIGACGLDVSRGAAFPKWRGDLLAGGLSGANVDRIRIKDDKVVEREELVHGMGRVRDVVTGPDGAVYIALNQPDKIIRLVPAK